MIPVDPLDFPADEADDEADDQAYAVRPYALTGGRTRASKPDLALEALVQAVASPETLGLTPERRRILELTAHQFLSVMELSAHVELPVGIVRVIVSDLADSGSVRIHGLSSSSAAPATSLSVLESVLNGISSL